MTDNHEVTMNELMEFLQENVATKGDLEGLRTELRTEMQTGFFQLRTEMEQGFSHVNTRFDSIDRELEGIKDRLTRLEQKVHEEGNMYAREVVGLDRRVDLLETRVKAMRAA